MDCEQHGTECRAKLSGRINIDSSPELRPLLLRLLTASHCRVLIVDFCEVVYIDTSGIAVLVQVLKSARQLGKKLQLSGLRERPRYLLESSGLLRLFDESDHK
jgi:anti-sigma B factor antagonist